MTTIDLTGQRFGRLVVVERNGTKNTFAMWLCKCDCGSEKTVQSAMLKRGQTQSCGCLSFEQKTSRATTHGQSKTLTYDRWCSMINRCTNPNQANFKRYGAAGISVCDRWGSFENFLADMGNCPAGHTLDRWPNGGGNYEPGNCRWATPKQQANNTKNSILVEYLGRSQTLKQWAEELGIKYATVHRRFNHSYPLQDVFSTDSFKKGRKSHV